MGMVNSRSYNDKDKSQPHYKQDVPEAMQVQGHYAL